MGFLLTNFKDLSILTVSYILCKNLVFIWQKPKKMVNDNCHPKVLSKIKQSGIITIDSLFFPLL